MFTPFAFRQTITVGGGGNDPDAQLFITATGITGSDATAINTLVLDLKAYSIWSKLDVIYPFVGGTATTNKYNLKNPLDTNGANRINFQGVWSFTSTGSQPTTNATYGDTFLNPSSSYNLSSGMSWGYYDITDAAASYSDSYQFGAYTGQTSFISVDEEGILIIRGKYCENNTNYQLTPSNPTNRQGLRQMSSANASTGRFTNTNSNESLDITGNVTGAYPNTNLWVGNLNLNGSPYKNTKNILAYAFIGQFLSNADTANHYTAVQAFQTNVGSSRAK